MDPNNNNSRFSRLEEARNLESAAVEAQTPTRMILDYHRNGLIPTSGITPDGSPMFDAEAVRILKKIRYLLSLYTGLD